MHPSSPDVRVVAQHRDGYTLDTPHGPRFAVISGHLRDTATLLDLPVTGDYVLVDDARLDGTRRIDAVLPRTSLLVRKQAGADAPQPIAANLDEVWIVSALDRDLNVRRIERYLAAVWDSGATPVIVLTKRDLCDDLPAALAGIAAATTAVEVHVVSAVDGEGLPELAARRRAGLTIGLVGSSGVGKSTLVNGWRSGEIATAEVSENQRGRHTTTARHLYALDDGSFIIDTPGMREFGLWDSDPGISAAFPEVEALASACRFTDCRHASEPGCAVLQALDQGTLDRDRFEAWGKLRREALALERRTDPVAAKANRQRWKSVMKSLRAHPKARR